MTSQIDQSQADVALENFPASPESLSRQDIEARNGTPESISKGSDFGSYARVNRGSGLSDSGIESHNLTAPINRVRIYRRATKGAIINSIADLGCGLGFTSAALAEVFQTTEVTGYEISRDACEFAARNWPQLKFVAEPVIPDSSLPEKYDLVLAQEFYPFTRTTSQLIHEQYAKTLAASLQPQGIALITLTEGSPESILSNLGALGPLLKEAGFKMVVFSLPFDRVYSLLPIYFLAKVASNILGFLLRKPRYMAIKITRIN